ncbi:MULTISPECIES: MgtC/SapB family protein [unclassified Mesorhizobium]|uniref:MgtC/SapB family protein n=1 Tax=unclassified Mesorhizobium TaxID=325217 RepID=UPI0015E40DC0|nr:MULTISPECIES: MgtC/SapB family protein [unclassified Mesorhizobium]MBZ9919758.1 MgtC/SapB family protein [Mesorhizobium sp. BR1-1-7]MBZ9954075.1 MgtC/SapB family protein [Mesorhizobium sp. BR1-1-15]MBZ9959568.1 MgtC/SapB family protein [Mesorhizobium sp. BR1-1-14]MBZ9973123.1 MgtC/SapB family protein [Mesorhizobium sp. BR1-1-12]UCI15484.1 MgtC/SapB family protein [Mesorhizobium sp. B2-1-1]
MEAEVAITQSILLKLVLALLLGALIGAERQYRQQYTGLVTHALVALGAAAYSSLPGALGSGLDLRMGAQVVTGIGFLGAGLIIRDGSNIRGLSTSATIWSTGSVGVFVGFGFLLLAAETAMLIIILNSLLPNFSRFFRRHSQEQPAVEYTYTIEIVCSRDNVYLLRSILLQTINTNLLRLRSLNSHPINEGDAMRIEATLFSNRDDAQSVERVVAHLALDSNVQSASWEPEEKTE